MKIEKFKVMFRPEDKEIKVEKGTTLLEAARKAKVIENLIRAKAAIFSGTQILVYSMNLEFDDKEAI